jgi:hypothetical protein
MAATLRQRQKATDVLRANGPQEQAAKAAGVSVSTIKRWLGQPAFQAMIRTSPDIRLGEPPRIDDERGAPESQQEVRPRMWVAGRHGKAEVLGSYAPPETYEAAGAVLHVHVVQPEAIDDVIASIAAGAYPAESPYIPVPLAAVNDLLDSLPLVCRLGSPDQRHSLTAWLEVWRFIDEDGRTRTLAEALWDGQRRFLEALLDHGHVLSIKSRKVGLSTLVCAHAAWTARIRDVNASAHLLSYRVDAAQELLSSLSYGFEGLPSFLRLPGERETSTVLRFSAGPNDRRSLKVFPATPNAAIEATSSHLVLDEWAHTFDPEAVWAAVEPTLAPRATSALITTARTPGDFVHDYYLRSEAGHTRHAPVFVSALERPDRSASWLEEKRRQEGKVRSLRNYPLSADEAFASASQPYFAPELLEAAQENALPPSPARRGARYLKAWDVGRKDASVCVVLRAPSRDEEQVWHVVGYRRLIGKDFPAIQLEIEAMHHAYPGPTVIEANSIGLPVIQNLRLPPTSVIEHTTTKAAKQAMLTGIELLLQKRTLKIHPEFGQLLAELANYRVPDDSIIQDSVMALGFAVANADRASGHGSGGRINRELFYELNGGKSTPPSSWLERQKIATDGPSYGLVRVVRDVSDAREMSEYQADALTGQLEAMLAQGWKVADPAALDKLGLRLTADGKLIDLADSA